MRKPRKIREPERFSPPAIAAASLRSVADQIARRSDWVSWSMSVSYATEDEVRSSLAAKATKGAAPR